MTEPLWGTQRLRVWLICVTNHINSVPAIFAGQHQIFATPASPSRHRTTPLRCLKMHQTCLKTPRRQPVQGAIFSLRDLRFSVLAIIGFLLGRDLEWPRIVQSNTQPDPHRSGLWFTPSAQKKIAVAVQRGVNDYGDRETDVTRTQHRSRQLVAIRIKRGSAAVGLWPANLLIGST